MAHVGDGGAGESAIDGSEQHSDSKIAVDPIHGRETIACRMIAP